MSLCFVPSCSSSVLRPRARCVQQPGTCYGLCEHRLQCRVHLANSIGMQPDLCSVGLGSPLLRWRMGPMAAMCDQTDRCDSCDACCTWWCLGALLLFLASSYSQCKAPPKKKPFVLSVSANCTKISKSCKKTHLWWEGTRLQYMLLHTHARLAHCCDFSLM